MPSSKECCVPGCKNPEGMRPVLHIFPNPQKDKELFIMWLSKIGGELLGLEYEFIFKYRRVCRRHFEPKYLCRRNRISKIAIPTLHTPALLLQKKSNTSVFNDNRKPLQQMQDQISPSTSSALLLQKKSNTSVFNDNWKPLQQMQDQTSPSTSSALLLQKKSNTSVFNDNRKPLQQMQDQTSPSTSSDQETKSKQVVLVDTFEIPPAPLPANMEGSPVTASAAATEETTRDMECAGPDVFKLNILGADEYGPDINKVVATTFCHIATTGLNKDARKELLKKYLVPENCKEIAAPLLDSEIKILFTEQLLERDKLIEARQKQIASCIAALGKIISTQLVAEHKNLDLLGDLMDVGRMVCDIQYNESKARCNIVKRELKDQLFTTKIDEFLIPSNRPKTAKAVYKSKSDL